VDTVCAASPAPVIACGGQQCEAQGLGDTELVGFVKAQLCVRPVTLWLLITERAVLCWSAVAAAPGSYGD
jgi:hypothetical protein